MKGKKENRGSRKWVGGGGGGGGGWGEGSIRSLLCIYPITINNYYVSIPLSISPVLCFDSSFCHQCLSELTSLKLIICEVA